MSVKRQATTELNHENWDQDDPEEHKEMGTFKAAPKEVLEKRVIRTAKRRSQVFGDEPKKSVFSGFGGFNKTQPSSFDFLANLTNGNKNTTSTTTKNDTSVTSSLFSSKPPSSSPGAGIFGSPTSSTPMKTTLGMPSLQTQTFYSNTNNVSAVSSIFTASKADSTVSDSTFKIHSVSSSGDTEITKTTNVNSTTSTAQVSSTIFGVPSTSAVAGKTLFSINNNDLPFKMQPVSSSSTLKSAVPTHKETEKKEEKNEKKMKYYAKLKGLNESVTEWIKKHVEETPLCILSPIFKDYEKYLKEIQEEYESPDKEMLTKKTDNQKIDEPIVVESDHSNKSEHKHNNTSSLFKIDNSNSKVSMTPPQNNYIPPGDNSKGFSFGINTATNTSTSTSTGFSFGTTSAQQTAVTTSATFAFSANTNTTSPNGAAPFSFGIGTPFSFNSNISNKQESSEPIKSGNDSQEEDAPPKVEFTPIAEENSVFDKRCKIFVKKDGTFVDKGVGTLYIKKIEGSDKHQLLVRANTTLGNVLLNIRLASAIPTQRMGKNNVMIVCIPTPDSKPPPTPILIRVKTSEEADQLLETLNKFKT